MSGLEILGLAASVIQIADLGAKLSVKLFTFSRKVKNADKSIDSISQDIAATGAVLAQLGNELNKEDNLRLRSPAAITTTKGLVESCEKLFGELNEAIDGGGAGGNGHKLIVELRRRLRFPFLEPQIELLRCNLERLKTSLLVILNVLILAEQLRSHKTGEILKDQHELLRTLVKEKDTSEQNFKRILQAVEASKSPEGAELNSDAGETPKQNDAPSLQANLQTVTDANNSQTATSAVSVALPLAIESPTQLTDHCLLISRILHEIGVVKYRIDYGQRDRVQKAVLKVHWDEWSQLRRKHGDKPLLELFAALRQDEVIQYWRQMAQTREEAREQGNTVDRAGPQNALDELLEEAPLPGTTISERLKIESPQTRNARLTAGRGSTPAEIPVHESQQDSRVEHGPDTRVVDSADAPTRGQAYSPDDSNQTIKDLLSGLADATEIARLDRPIEAPNSPFPTEASTLGFCKGAVRLLSPLESDHKRAFSVISRLSGMYQTVRSWKCRSCAFEGPVARKAGGDGTKKTRTTQENFETSVWESRRGVRYRWIFLAKSHVPLKGPALMSKDATFACLFCCAEGRAKGWSSEGTSGKLDGFMEHLSLVHREEGGWPSVEMRARMKCIVGRVAEVAEDWDVNLLPVDAGDESDSRSARTGFRQEDED